MAAHFGLYSIATIVVLLTFGAMTFMEAPRLQANLPTSWIGLWERINSSVFLLWVMVLSVALWRTGTSREGRIMSQSSAFHTASGEAKFRAAYDAALKLWPVQYEELDVPTRLGMTHVVVTGLPNAPPLVRLHGYMATSVMWGPNIADVSRDYRVYVIEVMGQPSKSVPREPIRTATDYVAWLGETVDGLHLGSVSLLGVSFGGSIALRYAVAAPKRVHSLVLLSPGGFLPIGTQFAGRGLLMVCIPTRFTVNSFVRWAGFRGEEAQRLLDVMFLGLKHFRMPEDMARAAGDAAKPLLDSELYSLRMPVLLLFGEGEMIYDSVEALARAHRLIRYIDGALIPDCRHEMCFRQSRVVDARVVDFLKRTTGRPELRSTA